jgi:hypothetical protein
MAAEKAPKLSVRWSGDKSDDPQVVDEIISNIGGLLGRMRIVCDGDGCGRERPEDHADWVRRDGLDFCPDCQRAA